MYWRWTQNLQINQKAMHPKRNGQLEIPVTFCDTQTRS